MATNCEVACNWDSVNSVTVDVANGPVLYHLGRALSDEVRRLRLIVLHNEAAQWQTTDAAEVDKLCAEVATMNERKERLEFLLDKAAEKFKAELAALYSSLRRGPRAIAAAVKDEVSDAGKENASDYGPDPWGGVPAPDPWTKPRSQQDVADGSDIYRPNRSLGGPKGGDDDNAGPSSSSKPVKTEKKLGVVGSLLAECFASQSHYKHATLTRKRIKSEPASNEGSANNGPAVGKPRKRRLGQQTATSTKGRKVEVVTLSSDEDKVPRRRAKKPKKHEKDTVIYVLSSDSDDQLDP